MHTTLIDNNSKEVTPSFEHILRIWWAVTWRTVPLIAILTALTPYVFHKIPATGFASYVTFLLIFFGFVCIAGYANLLYAFKSVIGKQFGNVRLDFTPAPLPSTWGNFHRVTLRYVLAIIAITAIIVLLTFPYDIIGSWLFHVPSLKKAATADHSLGRILISIFAFAFIINRPYGDVRLSLIKN